MPTLINLLSEQTIQNLLPVLALKPDRLIHLATARTADRHDWLIKAIHQKGLQAQVELIHLSEMPAIHEVHNLLLPRLEKLATAKTEVIVNFTGGTKLMAIGAFTAASKARVSSLYVDTDHSRFLDGGTGRPITDFIGHDLSFAPYHNQLAVNILAVANGRDRVTGGKKFSPYLPLAELLLRNPGLEEKCWAAFYGPQGLLPKGDTPRKAQDWLALLGKPLQKLPEEVATLAVDLKLLESRNNSFYIAAESALRKNLQQASIHSPHPAELAKLTDSLQFPISFLTGGWYEVVVAEAAHRSGRFHDLRWSAEVGKREFGGSMEEDVIAIDRKRLAIAYFSCKRGGARAKLSRQLEEMVASAERIGGSFAQKYFCVALPLGGVLAQSLPKRAKELKVTLLDRKQILAWLETPTP